MWGDTTIAFASFFEWCKVIGKGRIPKVNRFGFLAFMIISCLAFFAPKFKCQGSAFICHF